MDTPSRRRDVKLTKEQERQNFMKFEKKEHHLYKKKQYESGWARFVRIQAEVEKIWLLYDIDDSGSLEFDEIKKYLNE